MTTDFSNEPPDALASPAPRIGLSQRLHGKHADVSIVAALLWLAALVFVASQLWFTEVNNIERVIPTVIVGAPFTALVMYFIVLKTARYRGEPWSMTEPRTADAKLLRMVSAGAVAILIVLGPLWLTVAGPERTITEGVVDFKECMDVRLALPGGDLQPCYDIVREETKAGWARIAARIVLGGTALLALGGGAQAWQVILLEERDSEEAARAVRTLALDGAHANDDLRLRIANLEARDIPRSIGKDDVLAWLESQGRAESRSGRRALARAERVIRSRDTR